MSATGDFSCNCVPQMTTADDTGYLFQHISFVEDSKLNNKKVNWATDRNYRRPLVHLDKTR